MPYITHPNGQQTYYYDNDFADPWQPHETILIQHGFARHSSFWYKWIPILSKKYRVIRRDARGHGYSSVPDKTTYKYDIDTILSEIVDTLDQLGIKKVHYLGESTGGIWGEFLAARHPERLLSLTICSSPLYMPAAAQEMLAFGHTSWPAACREMGSRGWAEELASITGADQMPEGYLDWWLNEIAVAQGEGLGDHAELLCEEEFDARRIMDQINVPMLLLSPGNSKLVNLEEQKMLAAAVKGGAKMEIISGFGHEIYIDQAEECQEKFLGFLDGLER